MTRTQVLTLADGSIFTGSQGKDNGLIDAIGGEAKALEWLNEENDISSELKVIEYKPKRPGDSIFDNPAALQRLARIFGVNISNHEASEIEEAIKNRLLLDGLVSIWQGSR
ncbi:MAG: S49 family peptidase [Pseudomonadota bacterium]